MYNENILAEKAHEAMRAGASKHTLADMLPYAFDL